MPRVTVSELSATLEQLRAQLAEMSRHIEYLEKRKGHANAGPAVAAGPADGAGPAVAAGPAPAPAVSLEPAPAGIAEEELLAISAAIGAYLGVRAHIRQIRLVGTSVWAQEGRVSIQASHRL